MPSDWKTRGFEYVANHWHKHVVLVISHLVVAGLVVGLAFWVPSSPRALALGLWLLGAVVLQLIWWLTNRVPKIPKGTVGIVVAITADTEEEDAHLRSDFMTTLRDMVESDQSTTNFTCVVYSRRMASWITSKKEADYYLKRSGGVLLVYGRVRKRSVRGQMTHFVQVNGLIRHIETTEENKHLLATEFTAFLPRRRTFVEQDDVLEFEVTSSGINAVARYMVAVAALLAANVRYAEQLLLSVRDLLRGSKVLPEMRKLRDTLPTRLANLYSIWLDAAIREYVARRDVEVLQSSEPIADKLLAIVPTHTSALLHKGVCAFLLRRDIKEARTHIWKCKLGRDGSWRYSEAFFLAYENRLREAVDVYRSAFKSQVDRTIPVQVEEFIQLVLDEEPERYGLHLALGLINLEMKRDFEAAARELERFLQLSAGSNPAIETLAKVLLQKALDAQSEHGAYVESEGVPAALLGKVDAVAMGAPVRVKRKP